MQKQFGKLIQQPIFTEAISWITSFPVMNAVCTNVPGPDQPMYTLGQQCTATHPYMPVYAGMGIGFACISYNGSMYISAVSDIAAVPDIQTLKKSMDKEYRIFCGSVPKPKRKPAKWK
jgi:hypothetical protein